MLIPYSIIFAVVSTSLSAFIMCLDFNTIDIYMHVCVHIHVHVYIYRKKALTLSDRNHAPRARFRTSRSRYLTTHRNDDNNTDVRRDAEAKSHKDAHRLPKM